MNEASESSTGQTEPLLRLCEWDQCRPLQGQQKRFASDKCRAAWHDLLHPRLSPPAPLKRKATIRSLVLGILMDGDWHSAWDIANKIREDKHSIVARISQLKKAGHRIETDLPNGSTKRPHRYRLVA